VAAAALGLYAAGLALAFGWRSLGQWRRTGDTGLRLHERRFVADVDGMTVLSGWQRGMCDGQAPYAGTTAPLTSVAASLTR